MSLPDVISIKHVLNQLSPAKNDTLVFEDFARQLCGEFSDAREDEKRSHDRVELPPIPVEVRPLDDSFEASDPPFAAILRNISATGIGLMFGKPVQCKYLEIQVDLPSRQRLKTIIEVMHSTEGGFMIGGTATTEFELTKI